MHRLSGRAHDDEGFTLIELLVVVIIIGILAAIAIPVFLNQREKARNASARSDLRNLITAQEAYLTEKDVYTADGAALVAQQKGLTADVEHAVCLIDVSDRYQMGAKHASGDKVYFYDNTVGAIAAFEPQTPPSDDLLNSWPNPYDETCTPSSTF